MVMDSPSAVVSQVVTKASADWAAAGCRNCIGSCATTCQDPSGCGGGAANRNAATKAAAKPRLCQRRGALPERVALRRKIGL